jgi:multiple sugar transport system substrate-binding protein
MLKKVLVFLITLTVCVAMAGCGSDEQTNTDEVEATTKGEEKAADGTQENSNNTSETIKIAVGTATMEWLDGVVEAYKTENPDVNIELIEIMSGSDMYTKITMMMQSNQTSPDLITEDGFMINSDAAAGYLEPLDDLLDEWEDAKLFNPVILDGAKAADGVQYGIPYSTDVQGIWYNKDLFKQAGIPVPFEPKSWDDIMDVAKKLKENGDKDFIPVFFYASKTSPEETSMRTFQALYSGTNSELYDFQEKKWIMDKENLLHVFNFVNDVYNVEKVGPPLSIAAQQKVSDLFQSDYMKNNKLGMYFSGSWEASNWASGMKYEWPEGLDTWGFAKIPTMDGRDPGYTTMSGGWTWAIPANANNKEGGKDFLKFVANKENQLSYALFSGNLAVRTDVMEEETYKNQEMAVVNEAAQMLEYTHFRPSIEGYNTVTTMFTEVIESIAMATETPEEALEMYERELIRIVGEDNVIVK